MEFFSALIYKIKSNYFLLLVFILIIVINDVFILKYSVDNKQYNSVEKPIITEEKNVIADSNNKFKIDVKGKVKKPGVYEVDSNMNVSDAIKLAGGIKKGATTLNLNLSKKLEEEMVIVVSSIEKVRENIVSVTNEEIKNDALITNEEKALINDKTNTNENDSSLKLVNINTASLEELLTITGVGESKAKAIMSYRENNKFNSIEDIKNVSGIGDSLFEKIKDSITV